MQRINRNQKLDLPTENIDTYLNQLYESISSRELPLYMCIDESSSFINSTNDNFIEFTDAIKQSKKVRAFLSFFSRVFEKLQDKHPNTVLDYFVQKVPSFSREESDQLILAKSSKYMGFSQEALEKIYNASNGSPMEIQRIGGSLFCRYAQPNMTSDSSDKKSNKFRSLFQKPKKQNNVYVKPIISIAEVNLVLDELKEIVSYAMKQ